MKVYTNSEACRRCHESGGEAAAPPADVQIVTSDGQSIAAHSAVLASASPVLGRMIDRSRRGWNTESTIRILGVPSDAVAAFVRFLYSSRAALAPEEAEAAMERHGVQLLALAHAFRIGWLKRGAEAAVAARLTAEGAVDMLKLARLCDAPRLYLRCARLAGKDFAAVEQSEGWRFARRHDAGLELEMLQLLEEADQRKKRWKRERAAQQVYRELSEAMDCLEHIFAEGCTAPCARFRTCQGLQLLIRHFATCGKKLSPGGCLHCKRMWQLLRLHSSTCEHSEPCKVPLCSHFKIKMQTEEKVDKTWKLLVKKVVRARVMSSLANRRCPEIVMKSWARYSGARLRKQVLSARKENYRFLVLDSFQDPRF